MPSRRTILAFLVAPPLGIASGFLIEILYGMLFSKLKGGDGLEAIAGVLLMLVYCTAVAYLCELTLGIGAWIAFKHFGIRSPISFAAAGAAMGLLVMSVLGRGELPNGVAWLFFPTAGLCGAIVFRLIALPPNDTALRNEPKPHPTA